MNSWSELPMRAVLAVCAVGRFGWRYMWSILTGFAAAFHLTFAVMEVSWWPLAMVTANVFGLASVGLALFVWVNTRFVALTGFAAHTAADQQR